MLDVNPTPSNYLSRVRRAGVRGMARALVYHTQNLLGARDQMWCRVVMDSTTRHYISNLRPETLDVLEVSGTTWNEFGFKTYRMVSFPDYDVTLGPLANEAFDLVIMEQVLEHVLWPYRAVRSVYQMLRPGGIFLVTTPFLLRVHDSPVDCSRWTELGMKYLLAEGGFPLDGIETGSWGNRRCVRANFSEWTRWIKRWHSLKNEADFPVSVWAFARKPIAGGVDA